MSKNQDIDPDPELRMKRLERTTKTESLRLTTHLGKQVAATDLSLRVRKRSSMNSKM